MWLIIVRKFWMEIILCRKWIYSKYVYIHSVTQYSCTRNLIAFYIIISSILYYVMYSLYTMLLCIKLSLLNSRFHIERSSELFFPLLVYSYSRSYNITCNMYSYFNWKIYSKILTKSHSSTVDRRQSTVLKFQYINTFGI